MDQPTKGSAGPERIMQFAWGFAPPLMIEAAVRHGIFDTLDVTPKTAEEAAAATDCSVRGVRALLNGLTGFDLIQKDDAGKYTLSPDVSTFLVTGKPTCLAGFYRHTSKQLVPQWLHITDIVKTGRPATAVNQQDGGSSFFVDFVEDLFPLNYQAAKLVGEALGVPSAAEPISVLDLAAGSGVWGIAIAQQSPKVRVTAVDWPEVLAVTKRMAARFHLEDRFTFTGGDLHDADFGSGHTIATLGHILHSEGERRSKELLQKTFDALAPGGTIAIAEWIANEGRTGPPSAMIFAVNMLINTDEGDAFTFGEISSWLADSGFVDVRLVEAPGPGPLIFATKP